MMRAVANVAEIAPILDWRGILELGRPLLLLYVPTRTTVRGRVKEGALQRRYGPVHGALTPARDAGKGVLGGTAEGSAIPRRERTSQAGNQLLDVGGGGGHAAASHEINWPPSRPLFRCSEELGPLRKRALSFRPNLEFHATG